MIIRPTGLVDPEVEVRPTRNQVDDLMEEIRMRVERNERVLVTTLTKKMAEDLTDFLLEMGLECAICTARSTRSSASRSCATCARARSTCWSASICLREGLDLPEVSLVGILDADKEGYLRSGTSLIQTIGRAARNVEGKVHHVRRRRDRVDGAGDRRDAAPARAAGRVQPRARHRAAVDPQGGPRHPQRGRARPRKTRERFKADKLPREVALRTVAPRSSARCANSPRTSSSRRRRRCATS